MSASPEGPPEQGLATAGLGVIGVLDPRDYDARVPAPWRCAALLPDARSVWVLAAGGRALFDAFSAAPERALPDDPLDRYVARVVATAAEALAADGHRSHVAQYHERRGDTVADFVELARAGGLGAPSRLGLLLHPEYGPWLSIRALLLTSRRTAPTPPRPDFAPCEGCPAPCAAACRGAAVAASGPPAFGVSACAATRRADPGCLLACDARRACVVGREHAYSAAAEAHHMRASARGMGVPVESALR